MDGELRTRYVFRDQREEIECLQAAIEGAIALNMQWLGRRSGPADLGKAGIRYEDAVMCSSLCQIVDPIDVILRKRSATCFSVAAYGAARERMQHGVVTVEAGLPIWAYVRVEPVDPLQPHLFHATVGIPVLEGGQLVWYEDDPTSRLANWRAA